VLQEFGKKPAGPARTELFRALLQLAADAAATRGALRGCLAWMLAAPNYPDYDGYTIYEGGQPALEAVGASMQPVVPDPETPALLVAHAQALLRGKAGAVAAS
jgi:hypothetical protein